MASHFRWYPAAEDVVVPWNATYEFPSQANKAVKITPRIPPKNGSIFTPGQQTRLEFPAQGYINTANTTLEFDVTLVGPSTSFFNSATDDWGLWFQNNITSLINRMRLVYGSSPLEDIQHCNYIVRQMTEFTTTAGAYPDQSSITEGIGGVVSSGISSIGLKHTRRSYIQSLSNVSTNSVGERGQGVPNYAAAGGLTTCTRRYQILFPLGLFNQGKLLPVKYMASQLAIEITWENPISCMVFNGNRSGADASPLLSSSFTPNYSISNVNLIPEILEFDASYDQHFLNGLTTGGVPLQFATWHFFSTNITGSTLQMIIQERSRSVKAIFGFARLSTPTFENDTGASFGDLQDAADATKTSRMISYQYRIGGRYFPPSPVQVSDNDVKNGGCEAFIELQKALNTLGDYRLSANADSTSWNVPPVIVPSIAIGANGSGWSTVYGADDYQIESQVLLSDGTPKITLPANTFAAKDTAACLKSSSQFSLAVSLETTNGREISGLNAEEQSDISLIVKWSSGPKQAYDLEVYTLVDAMVVLRENNVVELIL